MTKASLSLSASTSLSPSSLKDTSSIPASEPELSSTVSSGVGEGEQRRLFLKIAGGCDSDSGERRGLIADLDGVERCADVSAAKEQGDLVLGDSFWP